MIDITTPQFDCVRDFMRRHRKKGKNWTENPLSITCEWLTQKRIEEAWSDDLSIEVWDKIKTTEIESEKRREEHKRIRDSDAFDATIADPTNVVRDISVPNTPSSCWARFKEKLVEEKTIDPSDIDYIELSVLETLRRLSPNTKNGAPIKGLVIGHVQSGKTTNIAALMNMAADWGFNVFLVLTGRIESLRKQTSSRINRYLCSGNLTWISLGRQLNTNNEDYRLRDLALGVGRSQRYYAVVLKNTNRLSNLLDWLQAYPQALHNMRLLVIDDESDEAGINIGNIEDENHRAAINNLILKIVQTNASGVNYVGYTATPYANVLNEAPGPNTLYPSSFIKSIKSNNSYFGPRQIFGIEGDAGPYGAESSDGLDIIRTIPRHGNHGTGILPIAVNEIEAISKIQSGSQSELDDAKCLVDAICWFLCATAVRRHWGEKTPVTMLIHTSQIQEHHQNLADAIRNYLQGEQRNAIVDSCEKIWSQETKRFTLDSLRDQYPEYHFLENIKNYPEFSEIQSKIINLLETIESIKIDDQGSIHYHTGIHLCIDNCAQSGITDEGEHLRLLYPERELDSAPAFIVVGGATLSRGLTLQGLVATYFLRNSTLGDSLLQMGRWFGYRVGYELLPRIWMTIDTAEKFRWLAGVEQSLREELKRYEKAGASPSKFGPRVRAHPSLSWLRITAAKRMQQARPIEWDFAGITNQTTMFVNSKEWLDHNLEATNAFLRSLPKSASFVRSSIVYRDIDFKNISSYLKKLNLHHRNVVFKEIDGFINWFQDFHERAGYSNWNVAAAGIDNAVKNLSSAEDPKNWWNIGFGYIKKVNRTRKGGFQSDGSFSIGALLAPRDRFADVDGNVPAKTPSILEIARLRRESGLESTPLLVIYRIDKDSPYVGHANPAIERQSLSVYSDVIGLAMIIPGERSPGGLVKQVTVHIDEVQEEHPDIE